MVRVFKPVCLIATALIWGLPCQAEERTPDATVTGNTYNEGPRNVFCAGDKEKKNDDKTSEKSVVAKKTDGEDAEKGDQKKQDKEVKEKSSKCEACAQGEGKCESCAKKAKCQTCGKKLKKCKCEKKTELTAEQIAAAQAEQRRLALEAARQKLALDERLRSAIKRLSTSGWREAQADLISGGKTSVPILIESLANLEEMKLPGAYNLGGHTKADAGRATRQRTVAEVCTELLTSLVKDHSDYKGELPATDQNAWQEWWTANAETVHFGK